MSHAPVSVDSLIHRDCQAVSENLTLTSDLGSHLVIIGPWLCGSLIPQQEVNL